MCSPICSEVLLESSGEEHHFGQVGGLDPDAISKLDKTVPAFTRKSQEQRAKLSQASSQTLRELIADGRLESEARSLLKKPDFLFGDSINEDVGVMLDGSYKWLHRLGKRHFFLPDMERMFSLSSIQALSLHRSMEWDLTEEQSEASLGQICQHTAIPVDHDNNVVILLPGP